MVKTCSFQRLERSRIDSAGGLTASSPLKAMVGLEGSDPASYLGNLLNFSGANLLLNFGGVFFWYYIINYTDILINISLVFQIPAQVWSFG